MLRENFEDLRASAGAVDAGGFAGSGVEGRSGEAAADGPDGLGSGLRYVGTSSDDETCETRLPAAEYPDSERWPLNTPLNKYKNTTRTTHTTQHTTRTTHDTHDTRQERRT